MTEGVRNATPPVKRKTNSRIQMQGSAARGLGFYNSWPSRRKSETRILARPKLNIFLLVILQGSLCPWTLHVIFGERLVVRRQGLGRFGETKVDFNLNPQNFPFRMDFVVV